nr:hypothetical protein GCM10020092_038050 [Actinoplanes digitatis]
MPPGGTSQATGASPVGPPITRISVAVVLAAVGTPTRSRVTAARRATVSAHAASRTTLRLTPSDRASAAQPAAASPVSVNGSRAPA